MLWRYFSNSSSVLPSHRAHSGRSRFRHCTPKNTLIIVIIIFAVLSIFHVARRDRWVRDLGYLSRPIWDSSDETPSFIINHYEVQNSPPGQLCAIHGWTPIRGQQPVKVYDSFLVSVEIDLLEIRMRELLDVVDFFLILEATRSFSGVPRTDFAFQAARDAGRFDFAMDKIRYALIDDLILSPPSPFFNEARMRNHMDKLLRDQGVSYGDIVLMSDVDEIPTASAVRLLKECGDWPSPLHLNMRNYRYSFEFPMADGGYWRPKAVKWNEDVRYNHGKASNTMLASAGWHCSWCFRYIEDIQFKMTGYSHNDRVKGRHQLEPSRINKHACEGSDIFDMYPEAYTFFDLYAQSGQARKSTSYTDIPDWIVRNPDRFHFLLPGGCARETRFEGSNA